MSKPNVAENPYIIAELGINHNGDIDIACQLVDMAVECGCDAVKLQKRTIDVVYSKELLASPRESPWGDTQRAQKEGLELSKSEYDQFAAYCKDKGIDWFASAWDEPSQEFLQAYDMPYNKIASAMLTHVGMLEMVAAERKPTFVSCGMSSWEMIDAAVEIFRGQSCPFTLLHCVSTYPSEDEECNVSAIETLRKRYSCDVGYSGHERGILPSVLAVACGAVVIERHITLDRTMYGSDQPASLEQRGLGLLVRDARRVADTLGDGKRMISDREWAVAQKLRYHET